MLKSISRFFLFICAFVAAWGTSGTLGWSLLLMLSVASFAFIFSVCDASTLPLLSKGSLRENPFFVSGLILIAINLIQVLNPYAKVVEFYGYQTVQFLEYVKFLPSGIVRDWGLRDSFFVLLQLAATWYVAMSSWKLLREDSMFARRFIKFLAINGTLIAVLGVAQEFTNAKGIYWLIPTNSHFYSTFCLRSIAGDFIFGSFLCCVSWSISNFNRCKYFQLVFSLICALVCMVSCSLSKSNGAVGVLIITIVAMLLFALWRVARKSSYRTILCVGFISLCFVSCGFLYTNFGVQMREQIILRIKSVNSSLSPRLDLFENSLKVFESSPILGIGSGAYGVRSEILSPQREYRGQYKIFLNSAHNDLLEYLCEYGFFALASIVLFFIIWLRGLLRATWSIHNSVFLWGCVMYILHSMFDMPLHTPSTMFAFVFFISLSTVNFRGQKC